MLMDNIVVWISAALVVGIIGIAFSRGLGKQKWQWFGFAGAALVLAAGIVCVYFVPTDEKKVKSTIRNLADAIAHNDPDEVCEYVAKTASKTRQYAHFHMGLAKIESARASNLEILEINKTTSPPRARVSFTGTVSGRALGPDGYPFTVAVRFTLVELRLEQDGVWRVTDECQFKYPGFATERAL